jgi:hypothetical protein
MNAKQDSILPPLPGGVLWLPGGLWVPGGFSWGFLGVDLGQIL